MIVKDFNQTLVQPFDHQLREVHGEGSYLRLVYTHYRCDGRYSYTNQVVIFLNDQGREVARTEETITTAAPPPPEIPLPVGRWYRLREGFYTALLGLQEMGKCLKIW